jgi:hypothetical protein
VLERSRRLAEPGNVPWSVWREVVGSNVARRSQPTKLSGSTLFVRVTSSAWAQELSFLSRSIIERLRRAGYGVNALRFSVGPVKLPRRATRTQKVRKKPLPKELADRLSRLDDPALRELIAQAASYDRGSD